MFRENILISPRSLVSYSFISKTGHSYVLLRTVFEILICIHTEEHAFVFECFRFHYKIIHSFLRFFFNRADWDPIVLLLRKGTIKM